MRVDITTPALTAADLRIPLPPLLYKIGIVGCGDIMCRSHLPAYRKFGYSVTFACDTLPSRAAEASARYGIPRSVTRVEDLAASEDVEVVDVAVRPSDRRPVIERICTARSAALRGLLAQKPLAPSFSEAEDIVAMCRANGLTLMVNHQARWAPSHGAMRALIERGTLGHVFNVSMQRRSCQDAPDSPYRSIPDFNILDHGLHYVDLVRYLTGQEPLRVQASSVRVPGQFSHSPMYHVFTFEFPRRLSLLATCSFNNIVRQAQSHDYAWIIDGTLGTTRASWDNIEVYREGADAEHYTTVHSWYDDAFAGSMGELMMAIADGREPSTNGEDSLRTMHLCTAIARSARSGLSVEVGSQ